ncbi:MAG: Uma2 family endonuclease [Cyanobacteria bacterium]|nr:Uma2 family endonuclease [Cyanobacteriota bacterium]MDW8201191.1 Uma2 family endonuclease [Cyanobacteriota bacterium SKYGB_h_bin112]
MVTLTQNPAPPVIYPSCDGEPLAETSVHLDAIIAIVTALRHYLGDQALVLSNQFLYYAQGFPRLRVAPDGMVIFGVSPGGRDNYKLWEEGQVPAVIFEVTSASTQANDDGFKKTLYEQLGVAEYWQFDPKGEWIENRLRGYRLVGESYAVVNDYQSTVLQLRLEVEGNLLSFYRLDTGEKLLIPDELYQALQQEMAARREAEKRAEQLEAVLAQYRDRFGELPN